MALQAIGQCAKSSINAPSELTVRCRQNYRPGPKFLQRIGRTSHAHETHRLPVPGYAYRMKIETESLERGDRVVATREVYTTQGFHIPEGAEGTVAEDRGANLVVFFADGAVVARLVEQDLAKVAN